VVSLKNKKTKTKYHLFFTCHEIRDWEPLNLILPCFDRSSSNFPIAKGKGRKIRNGRGVNPGQGQSPDQEAGRELGPDQDHQIATEKGVRTRREKRRKGASPKVNPKVQNHLTWIHQKEGDITMSKMK